MTLHEDAALLVADCIGRGLTLATAESLTAGLLASTIAEIPGCSAMLRGSLVTYHVDLKQDLLDVSDDALADGVVSRAVALEMARAAARLLVADIGVATTGVAGPDPHDGAAAGSVWIAVSGPTGDRAAHLVIDGDRQQVRRQTVAACLALVTDSLRE